MIKYAFVMNVPGECPDTYSITYEDEGSLNLVVGTGNMEMAEDLIKKLAKEGFVWVDLCGDFDDAITAKLSDATEGKVRLLHADYLPLELQKLNALEDLTEYGVIIKADDDVDVQYFELKSNECNAYIAFAKDIDDAGKAAKRLMVKGVAFIELCGWFDKEKTEMIIEAIEGKVPVGTCGSLS